LTPKDFVILKNQTLENVLDQIETEQKLEVLKWTRLDKAAIWMAIISFTIGTLLLLSFKVTEINSLATIGFFFVMAAVTINSLMVLILLFLMFTESHQKWSHLKAIGILLINIPITLLYLQIVFSSNF